MADTDKKFDLHQFFAPPSDKTGGGTNSQEITFTNRNQLEITTRKFLMDNITEETTPDEFDQLVRDYLAEIFPNQEIDENLFETIRDALLHASIFAPLPGTFDQYAMSKIFPMYMPSVNNMRVLTAILEDFGVIQKVSSETHMPLTFSEWWAQRDIQEAYPEAKQELVPDALYQALIERHQELTKDRYAISPGIKKIIEAVFDKYDE